MVLPNVSFVIFTILSLPVYLGLEKRITCYLNAGNWSATIPGNNNSSYGWLNVTRGGINSNSESLSPQEGRWSIDGRDMYSPGAPGKHFSV